MLRVGINGFGTIGKRVADAVRAQPDMTVAGVSKRSPNFEAEIATDRGYALYAAGDDGTAPFEDVGVATEGTVHELIPDCDVLVDATPAGVGAQNAPLYDEYDTPVLYQGGEDADVAAVSFNARANYEAAVGADSARVVSCNTTALARLLAPLEERFGVEKVRVTLVRRGGDPAQTCRGPINDVVPDPATIPSHHGPDVETVLPGVPVDTMAMKVPTTLMHTHAVNATLEAEPDVADITDAIDAETRLFVVPERLGIDGAGKLKDYAKDVGRTRGDVWENCVWEESVSVQSRDCYLFQAIHQEADVVPENVDAIRAIADVADRETSMQRTDETLGVGTGLAERRTDGGNPTLEAAANDD